jgi:hypothetical protein
MNLHPSITVERVIEAIERRLITLNDRGFCLACGEEASGVEPDARDYECEACGQRQVWGADDVLISFAF